MDSLRINDDSETDSSARQDIVEKFFGNLVSPEQDFASRFEDAPIQTMYSACHALLSESVFGHSADPDLEYIMKHAAKTVMQQRAVAYLYQQFAALALAKGVAADDDSNKARQLRYSQWMAEGRKDETSPFLATLCSEKKPVVSKAFLAEDPSFKKCAECGNADANTNCSGCLIRKDGHSIFATAYCGKDCQVKHWKKHKGFCKQLKQIHRASSVFQEIFEHLIIITYPINQVIEEITEKNGMVMVKATGHPIPSQPPAWHPFPLEIAPSPELGVAAALHSSCNVVFKAATPLIEMLIRPISTNIERICFDPKNIERPVCVSDSERDQFNSMLIHEAACVTLPCGVSVVLDPSAHQFGWKENISPYDQFYKQRVHNLVECDDVHPRLPGSRFRQKELAANRNVFHKATGEDMLMESVVLSLMQQIKAQFGGVKGFLQLKESEFTAAKVGVVAAAKRGLSLLAKEIDNLAQPIMIHDPAFSSGPASPEFCETVELVWCSRVERAAAAANASRIPVLQKKWRARWSKVIDIKRTPGQGK